MGDAFVFDTEAEAEAAQDVILQVHRAAGNIDIDGQTDLPADPQITVRWAEPRQREDGKWIVPVPPMECGITATQEPYAEGWFPAEPDEGAPGSPGGLTRSSVRTVSG